MDGAGISWLAVMLESVIRIRISNGESVLEWRVK